MDMFPLHGSSRQMQEFPAPYPVQRDFGDEPVVLGNDGHARQPVRVADARNSLQQDQRPANVST